MKTPISRGFRIGTVAMALTLILSAHGAEAAQCGTAILFQTGKKHPIAAFKVGNMMLASAVDNRARTLETDHFLIHYSLRGLHKVRTGPEDSLLTHAADSLYAVFAALPDARRDSAVYAHLDAAGAPHPAFTLKLREDAEGAWDYYIGKLGMKAPHSQVLSVQYNVSSSLPRKFPIDLVDVGTADRDFYGETYAVTYPPTHLSITFENDFLWGTRLDSQGHILGDSIQSRVGGKVLHNYVKEWDLGIKVTLYHEFYHAVQFTYNPNVQTYHAWYEISAVGMEERNAPEVNDYFQYLPCVLYNHDRVALTSLSQGPCTHAPMYGHGIFHQYLSHTLDSAFDVKVWDELSRNGDALPAALASTSAKYGKSITALYTDYAAQLLFSGKRFHPPGTPFSPDMPLWPDLAIDSVDLTEAVPYRIIKLPAVTFAVLKVKWDTNSIVKHMVVRGPSGITRIHADADHSIVEPLAETEFNLGTPQAGFQEYYLVIANPSFTDGATVEIKSPEAQFYAFPNPVRTSAPATLHFSQAKGMAFPASVQIFGENGNLVRTVNYAGSDAALVWDLRDAGLNLVKPGIYYYRLENTALRPLVILK